MPHLEGEPQHFFKTAEEKSIHRNQKLKDKKRAISSKMYKPKSFPSKDGSAWDDAKDALGYKKKLKIIRGWG